MKKTILSILCASATFLSAAIPQAAAQADPQQDLAAASAQVRAGHFVEALFSLNRLVRQASRPDQATLLARVHAYRTQAYVGMQQPERALNAAQLAVAADPAIAIDPSEFTPAVAAVFESARHPDRDSEAAGDAALAAGNAPRAFLHYLNTYRRLPDPPPAADDRRLREKIIAIAGKSSSPLIVPPEATDHLKKADDLLGTEAVLGASAATEQAAAVELRQALRIAPWLADPTLKLATILQKQQHATEALDNLNLYKAAAKSQPESKPESKAEAPPAATASTTIYVYMPHASRAAGTHSKLSCDGALVAELGNNRFVVLKAQPGFHVLDLRGRKEQGTFNAGEDRYIRAGIEGYPAHFALHLTDTDKATAEMQEKQVAPNDADRTFSATCGVAAGESPSKKK